jgi:hypothetical protein
MVEPQLADLARRLTAKAKTLDHSGRAEARHRQLQALAGRLLTPGRWAGGARRAGAEPLITGRARPYGESTLRKAARVISAHGAVRAAEEVLQAQVAEAVGKQRATAFTDKYGVYRAREGDAVARLDDRAGRPRASGGTGATVQ